MRRLILPNNTLNFHLSVNKRVNTYLNVQKIANKGDQAIFVVGLGPTPKNNKVSTLTMRPLPDRNLQPPLAVAQKAQFRESGYVKIFDHCTAQGYDERHHDSTLGGGGVHTSSVYEPAKSPRPSLQTVTTSVP